MLARGCEPVLSACSSSSTRTHSQTDVQTCGCSYWPDRLASAALWVFLETFFSPIVCKFSFGCLPSTSLYTHAHSITSFGS